MQNNTKNVQLHVQSENILQLRQNIPTNKKEEKDVDPANQETWNRLHQKYIN